VELKFFTSTEKILVLLNVHVCVKDTHKLASFGVSGLELVKRERERERECLLVEVDFVLTTSDFDI